jgi:hypothetical protein
MVLGLEKRISRQIYVVAPMQREILPLNTVESSRSLPDERRGCHRVIAIEHSIKPLLAFLVMVRDTYLYSEYTKKFYYYAKTSALLPQ